MKNIFLLAALVLFVTFVLLGTGLAIPLSEIDIGWFRENPMEPVWGKDPFVPKVRIGQDKGAPIEVKDHFVLTAVLLGGEKPAAIINGSVVQVGDKVNNFRVVKITRKSIFLKGPSGTTEIPLKPLFSIEESKP